MPLSEVMALLSVSERYRPAFFSEGKEAMIVFWVRDPVTTGWRRVKEKLNHVRDVEERRRHAKRRIRDINLKLSLGWNPLLDQQAPRSATALKDAIAAFLSTKEREEKRPDSMRSYRSLCGILQGWLASQGRLEAAVGTLTEDEAVSFMDDAFRHRGLSPRTFNNYKAFFGTLCLWWVKHRYLRTNVFAGVERKHAPRRRKNRRPFTEEERRQVRIHLEQHHPRFLAFSLLVYHCALRPKEALYLKPHHFNLEALTITVEASFAKNGDERIVCIPDVLAPVVLKLGLEAQAVSDYVFSTRFRPGPLLKRSTYSGKHWAKVRRSLGLPMELKHYSLRDTAVLQLARDGVSRADSQNHFDHSSSAMQDIYSMHAEHEGNAAVRRKASPF